MSLSRDPEQPRIGVDEWVASAEERRAQLARRPGAGRDRPRTAALKLLALVVPFAVFPLFVDSAYLMQVGIDTLIFVLLALGLNVAVGWVGLLDLGFVAFFGIGAYLYAALASEYAGRHWDATLAIPLIAVAVAVVGFLVGLPSRRLVGDYLAIVTLFFLQLWLVVLINASWSRGPNGISDIYPLQFFGRQITSLDGYYYVALVAFVLIISFLYLLNQSRTGRAWRALREDELAAELMTMPVSRLKLMGFAVGAGVAGVAGAIFAPVQGAVFPANFDLVLLITVYAMVVLGGAGSLLGVTMGAVLINAALEALRDADNASWIFYGILAIALIAMLRPWWQPSRRARRDRRLRLRRARGRRAVTTVSRRGALFRGVPDRRAGRLLGPATRGHRDRGRAAGRLASAARVHRTCRRGARSHAGPQPSLAARGAGSRSSTSRPACGRTS